MKFGMIVLMLFVSGCAMVRHTSLKVNEDTGKLEVVGRENILVIGTEYTNGDIKVGALPDLPPLVSLGALGSKK